MKFVIYLLNCLIFLAFNVNATTLPEGLTKALDASDRRIYQIQTPNFDTQLIDRYVVGTRPNHKIEPQIRATVEKRNLTTFILVDNFGFGPAGLTVNWGAAELAYEALAQKLNEENINSQHTKFAILGQGAIGLTMAYELVRQGFRNIEIFSKDEETTSARAAGMVYMLLQKNVNNPQLYEQLLKRSHLKFAALARQFRQEIEGIEEKPLITFSNHQGAIETWKLGLVPRGEPVILQTDKGKVVNNAVLWERGFYQVNPDVFLPSLKKYALKNGVTFTRRTFTNKEEFFQLGAGVVINCLSFGNVQLGTQGSDALFPSKGMYSIQQVKPLPYQAFGQDLEGNPLGWVSFPTPSGTRIGVTRRPNDPSEHVEKDEIEKMYKSAKNIFGMNVRQYVYNQVKLTA